MSSVDNPLDPRMQAVQQETQKETAPLETRESQAAETLQAWLNKTWKPHEETGIPRFAVSGLNITEAGQQASIVRMAKHGASYELTTLRAGKEGFNESEFIQKINEAIRLTIKLQNLLKDETDPHNKFIDPYFQKYHMAIEGAGVRSLALNQQTKKAEEQRTDLFLNGQISDVNFTFQPEGKKVYLMIAGYKVPGSHGDENAVRKWLFLDGTLIGQEDVKPPTLKNAIKGKIQSLFHKET